MIYPILKMLGSDYSIGVVTYVKRFEQYFKPLVKSLEKYFPKVEKNYVLNGFYDPVIQAEYLKKAKEFLCGTSASNVIAYNESQPLARCFNQLILHSTAKKILILNDDLLIRFLFRPCLELQIWTRKDGVINKSWSHCFLSKDTVKKVGWWDERFPAIGNEDLDYSLRMHLAFGKKTMRGHAENTIYCFGVRNIAAKNEDPGWKLTSKSIEQKTASVNEEFFYKKWEVSKTPLSNSVFAFNLDYYRIRPGMETPQFYDMALLDNPLKSPLK